MVALLPDEDNLQTIYKGAIEEVRSLYDSMTDYQKRFVNQSDLSTLEKLEARLKELLDAEESSKGVEGSDDSTEGSEDAAEGTEGTEETT